MDIILPSNKKFGYSFAVIFALIAAYGVFAGTMALMIIGGAGALGFCLMARLLPHYLIGLNRAWYHVGLCLGKIISPIVLGIMFYGLITPVALLGRAAGRDPLRLRKDNKRASFWIARDDKTFNLEQFKNQF